MRCLESVGKSSEGERVVTSSCNAEKARATNGRQAVGLEAVGDISPLNLLNVECRKEDSNLHPLARTRT